MAPEYRLGRVVRAPTITKQMEGAFERHRGRIAARYTVKTADALVRMVDTLGFCFAFTAESAYPIPAAFDHLDTRSDGRKWEWMWGWKDELAAKKRLYYGKLLVRKPTFVSMKMLPIFYATFGRPGDPDDHLEDVRAARRASSADAMSALLAHLLDLAGGVTERQVTRLFDWSDDRVAHAARRLEMKKALVRANGLLVLPTLR